MGVSVTEDNPGNIRVEFSCNPACVGKAGAIPAGHRRRPPIYGCGPRLRVKNIDFGNNHIIVRDVKGIKGRVTVLPGNLKALSSQHLERAKPLHGDNPAKGFSVDPGSRGKRRHYISERRSADRRSNRCTPRVGPNRSINVHALPEAGYGIRAVQELPGHKDAATTMIYAHAMNKPGLYVKSPLDA